MKHFLEVAFISAGVILLCTHQIPMAIMAATVGVCIWMAPEAKHKSLDEE